MNETGIHFMKRFQEVEVDLAKNLYDTILLSQRISEEYVPKSAKYLESNTIRYEYSIYVDLNEEQPKNAFKGYFVFDGVLHRFLEIILDFAALFPKNDDCGDECFRGVSISKIQNLLSRKPNFLFINIYYDFFYREMGHDKNVFFNMSITSDVFHTFGSVETRRRFYVKDDLGKPVEKISLPNGLALIDIPENLKNQVYVLDSQSLVSPYIAENVYCILFAEEFESFSRGQIRVFRWHPQNRKNGIVSQWGNVFFEMGILISDNTLYDFMTKNRAQVLFAKMTQHEITILGSIKLFLTSNLSFPKCFSKINLY